MEKLPFLVSIPHGGDSIPPEIEKDVCITPRDMFDDSDSFTILIYNVGNIVEELVTADIARAFVDNSRSKDQLPPGFPDGLIKSATCYNKPIYKKGKQPDKDTTEILINTYYNYYHQRIQNALRNPNILLALDCHSMAEIAQEISPDKGNNRPLINLGDADGTACDPYITQLLRNSFMEVFSFEEKEVTINNPFKGGFITRNYGNNPTPWIQIEMNRKLYLSEDCFDYDSLKMKNNRLDVLSGKFREVLSHFYENYQQELNVSFLRKS